VCERCRLNCIERDVTFVVFRNEHGEAEFAMQVVKDAKSMTFTPDKGWVLTPQGIFKAFQNY
jgi:hypothetical protein